MLAVEQLGLAVEELLDFALQVRAREHGRGRRRLAGGGAAADAQLRRARRVVRRHRLRAGGGSVARLDHDLLREQVLEVGAGGGNRVLGRPSLAPQAVMYCAHARNWLRITASEVPWFE